MSWRIARADLSLLFTGGAADQYLDAGASQAPAAESSWLAVLRLRLASDEDLAEQLKIGNADALFVLFQRHGSLLYKIARRILRNDAEAEDAVQQIFLDAFRSIQQFDREKGNFKSWLLMFAYQRTFNSRRSQVASRFFETDPFLEGSAHEMQPARRTSTPVEDGILVEQVLRQLQPRQRRTIELIYRQGLTAEEVAIQTGESVRVVRHNLYRGIQQLRGAFVTQATTKHGKKAGPR